MTSPAMPEPPMPSTTMLRTDEASGNEPRNSLAASCAAVSCSGRQRTASRNRNESVAILMRLRPCVWLAGPSRVRVEGRRDPFRFGLLRQPRILGVVDGFGFVDQHD